MTRGQECLIPSGGGKNTINVTPEAGARHPAGAQRQRRWTAEAASTVPLRPAATGTDRRATVVATEEATVAAAVVVVVVVVAAGAEAVEAGSAGTTTVEATEAVARSGCGAQPW